MFVWRRMSSFGLEKYEPLDETVLKKLDASMSRRLLDIGCGSGAFLSRISDINKDTYLFGIDRSPEMVRMATETLGEKAEIRLCDICSEPVPCADNSFDRVVCLTTFHEFHDPKKALSEIHRVVRPKGCVIIADKSSFIPMRQLHNLLLFRLSRRGDVRLYSESELRGLLGECGFSSVTWQSVAKRDPPYRGFVATATPSKQNFGLGEEHDQEG